MSRLVPFFVFFLTSAVCGAQILIDEGRTYTRTVKTRAYASGLELKRERKMGIGTGLAGAYGLIGVALELNFKADFGMILGGGLSRGFGAVNLAFRRTVGSGSFLPYFVAGYANWNSNEEGRVDKTSPHLLKNKFLSKREIATGEFNEHILYPGVGIQYINRSGDWAGLGIYAEVLGLLDVDDFKLGATGGLGSVYYF